MGRNHAGASGRTHPPLHPSRGFSFRYLGLGATAAATATLAATAVWLMMTVVRVSADDVDTDIFTPRSFDGMGNNEANPDWGAAGTTQVGLSRCVGRRRPRRCRRYDCYYCCCCCC